MQYRGGELTGLIMQQPGRLACFQLTGKTEVRSAPAQTLNHQGQL